MTKLFCELEEGLKGKAHLMHMKKAHQYDFQPSLVNFTNRETMGNFMQKKKLLWPQESSSVSSLP